MTVATRFLHQMAQGLATLGLYAADHPATARARDGVWQALRALLAEQEEPTFLFLGGAPVFQDRALHELADWPWRARLSRAGVRRLEFSDEATEEALAEFLLDVHQRIASGAPADSHPDEVTAPGIRYGRVAVVDQFDDGSEVEEADAGAEVPEPESREFQLDLTDELEAVDYILAEAARGLLARSEADAVVRILGSYLDHHELPQAGLPEDHRGYPAFHAVNSALLAMAVGNALGIDPSGRHRLGIAMLLHNIGMARLPEELILTEEYSPEDRERMQRHVIEGAKLLAGFSGPAMELAATVAYEHHLRPDGSGYPGRRFRPSPHWASRLAAACGGYVALRAPRPFRPAWSPEKAILHLEEGAGSIFDREAAQSVAHIVRVAKD